MRGGIDVPVYLGSRATFTLGLFGGHGGRALQAGDVLHIGEQPPVAAAAVMSSALHPAAHRRLGDRRARSARTARPTSSPTRHPQLFATAWKVHHNSSRTGVRLIGPKPRWARPDGGEAGLHPSNIHDNAYAVGTIDFTGDMPIILGPDGPSLGGFVCPATIVEADLWKVGQLKAGDTVRFVPVSLAEARRRLQAQERAIETLRAESAFCMLPPEPAAPSRSSRDHAAGDGSPRGRHPAGRRRQPAGRVRAAGAGPGACASACTR